MQLVRRALDTMGVNICVAVQNGRAVGMSVSTDPAVSGISASCVAGQIRSMGSPSLAHPRLDVSTTHHVRGASSGGRRADGRRASASRAVQQELRAAAGPPRRRTSSVPAGLPVRPHRAGCVGQERAAQADHRACSPDRGHVLVDAKRRPRHERAGAAGVPLKFGMLFQNNALFDYMTVGENIAFPLRGARPSSMTRRSAERGASASSVVSLPGFEDRVPAGLSGGQKKRVGVARATVIAGGDRPLRRARGRPRRSGRTTRRTRSAPYYLSAEFLLGRALLANLQALGIEDRTARCSSELGVDLSTTSSSSSPTRASATAASGASRRASSSRSRRSAARHGLRHPLRVRHLRAGDPQRLPGRARRRVAPLRQPVGDRAPRVHGARGLRRPHRDVPTTAMAASRSCGAASDGGGRARTTRRSRATGTNTVNTLRLWAARAAEEFDFGLFNAGDYVRAVQAKNDSEVDLEGALPQRQLRGRPRAAPAPGVLLRRVLHPRHRVGATRRRTRLRRASPTRSPSSSTTRTPPSPSPS
jgi:hypothetical protein